MLAIIAALPREVAGLVRNRPMEPALRPRGIHLAQMEEAIVAAAGMGRERVMLAVEAALQVGQPHTLVSVGLAGACQPTVLPGSVVEANLVVDVRTGEKFQTAALATSSSIVLATSSGIASVHEKARLAETYGAALVDMEAATVARLAQARGLAFRAIKGVSDAHDFELASLARFEGKHGSFRTGRFALHTALRPHHWRRAATLGRGSAQALAALARSLRPLVEAAS